MPLAVVPSPMEEGGGGPDPAIAGGRGLPTLAGREWCRPKAGVGRGGETRT